MKDFNYTQYRKNNPLLKEAADQKELSNYVESASQKCFDLGGNGQNILDGASELANFLDNYMETAHRNGPEEEGFYTQATAIAFKKFIDAMVKDEITNNNASKYGGGSGDTDDEDERTPDPFANI